MKILKLTIFILSFFLLANNAEAANSSEFTLAISLKASSSVATKAIVSKADEMRIVTDASDHPSCQIFPGGGNPWLSVVSSKAIKVNVWSRIACTYNQKYLKIFVDGKETGSQALTVSVDDTSNALKIGAYAGVGYGNLAGLVDDFRFYSYALNEEEIKKDYNNGKATVMGSASTASDGVTKTNAKNRDYCVPGDTATCDPPVLELKMDEKSGSTVYDTSGNGETGTFGAGSASPAWANGKMGSAVKFDGVDDYLSYTCSECSSSTYPTTLNFWFKPDNLSGTQVLTSYPPASASIAISGGDYLHVGTSENRMGVNISYIDVGQWNYLSIVFNSALDRDVYINGIDRTVASNDYWNVNGYEIGLRYGTTPSLRYPFKGKIDNFKIYNYARTPAQIAWDYNHGKPVAEWRFDECAGSTIHDESGNGNHGTLHLGTTGVIATGTCASSSDSFWYNGRNGKYNSSGSFDGQGDYIDIGDIGSTTNTVSFWLKPDSLSGSIINLDDGIHTIYISSGILSTDGFSSPSIYIDGELLSTIDTNWHHVLITTDTTIDASNVWIGKGLTLATFFDGQIDEVKIWNYVLTVEQVKSEYNDGAVKFGL